VLIPGAIKTKKSQCADSQRNKTVTALSFETPAKRNPREYQHIPYIGLHFCHW